VADAFTLTLSADHVTPLRAYAALRSHAPHQSSFLFESLDPGQRWSIVGYRALGENLFPPGEKAFSQILEEMAPNPDAPSGLAERLSQALVGYIAYEAVHSIHSVESWEHQGSLSRLMKDATIALFDHQLHTVTLAGASRGAVKRAAWEMTHGPELPQITAPDPSTFPDYFDAMVADAAFAARLVRAQRYVEAGEVEHVVLARTFLTSLRNADPLDVYRALRLLAPAPYLYFIEFGGTPFAPGVILAGSAAVPAVLHTAGDVTPDAAFKASFPSTAGTGTPKLRALQIVRELEHGARGLFGGAVGYILPDGSLTMAAPLHTLSFQDGQVEITGSTVVRPGYEGDSTRRNIEPALAAVRAAQDAATAREAAEESRLARVAAKEQAEREKAEREQAEREQAEREGKAEASGEGKAETSGEGEQAASEPAEASGESEQVASEPSASSDQ
jgi:anthranilate synthase component I